MQQLDDLNSRALVGVRDKSGLVRTPVGTRGGSTLSEASFGALRLTEPGETLYRLMRLDEIPQSDRDEWVAGLAGSESPANRLVFVVLGAVCASSRASQRRRGRTGQAIRRVACAGYSADDVQ
jgi:hypothetical protein